MTQQANKGVCLEQQVNPRWQNDQQNPEIPVPQPADHQGHRVTDDQRNQRDQKRVQHRVGSHCQVGAGREEGRVIIECKLMANVEEWIVKD